MAPKFVIVDKVHMDALIAALDKVNELFASLEVTPLSLPGASEPELKKKASPTPGAGADVRTDAIGRRSAAVAPSREGKYRLIKGHVGFADVLEKVLPDAESRFTIDRAMALIAENVVDPPDDREAGRRLKRALDRDRHKRFKPVSGSPDLYERVDEVE